MLGFPAYYNNLIPESTRRFPRFDFPSNTVLSNGMSNEFRPVSSHFVTAILNKALEKHSLKFGGELRIYREDDNFQSNDQTGQFIFDNTYTRPTSASSTDTNGLQAFAAFLLGYPTTLNIVRRADYSEYSKTWGFFAQDDWRVSNKLTLNLGLRWEFETPLTERQNKSVSGFDTTYVQPLQAAAQAKYATLNDPTLKAVLPQITATGGLLFAGKDTGSGLYKTPKTGFLPRAGFAYQWNQKTVIRGGFGLYQGFLGERRGDVIQPGYTQTSTAVLTTNANGAPLPVSLATPFANTTILEPVGNSLGKQTALGQAISFFNQNPKVSKQARWQIGFQRELPGGWVAEAVYVGNYGYNIEITRNINAIPNQYLNTDNSRTAAMNSNNTFLTTTVANPFQGLIPNANATITRANLLRPFPEFGDITTTNNDGKSWYHSGQFSLQKRFTKDLGVQFAYTRSKWIQATEYLNAADPKPTKMISDQDSPNRFSMSGFYALPFGKGQRFMSHANRLVDAIIGGWQIQGTYAFQSGFPVNFSNDLFYRGGEIALRNGSVSGWFNQAAFQSFLDWPSFLPTGVTTATATSAQVTAAQTAANTAATPVNHLRTFPLRFSNVRIDSINNADLGLRKDIHLRETMKIQLRMEFLNAFNHPLFPGPIVNPATGVTDQNRNSTFGQISSSNLLNYARRAQLGVKFIF
ncbi:MAG TPA: TonB-dependent receptor [Pyrinomonadaceae bacterium]|nr:TonB-dependent receptor [Pyrinomonadaceae bacterium]